MTQEDHYTRGLWLYGQGRYTEAISALEPVRGEQGLTGRVARFYQAMSHRAIGIEALRDGDFNKAEDHLRAVVEEVGRGCDLTKYLASLFAGTGRYRQCANEMEKEAESDPDSPAAQRKLALAQWQAGQRPQAYMTLTQAVRKHSEDSSLHLQLGLFYAAEEQYVQAKGALTQAVEADCTNPDAHYYLAMTEAAQQNTRAAVTSFQRAFELRPDDLLTAYQLSIAARASEESGHPITVRLPEPIPQPAGSEIRQLAQYLCQEPGFVEAFLALPASAIDDDLFDLLAGILQMAIDEHPTYADLHHYCSRVFRRLRRLEAAANHGRRAIAINPRYVQALINMGQLCAELNRPQEAVEYLERATACGGDWPDVHCLAGDLMQRINQPDRARKHLKRALELNPDYTQATESLDLLAA